MKKGVKSHEFTVDVRFQVIATIPLTEETGISYIFQNQASDESLGLKFPLYQFPEIENKLKRQEAELKALESDFVTRLQTGGNSLMGPSASYNLRLLNLHYSNCTSHSSRVALIAHMRRILRAAIQQTEYDLAYPSGWLAAEAEENSGYLATTLNLLKDAYDWTNFRDGELKVARLQEKEPTRLVRAMGYLILLAVDRSLLTEEELPAHYTKPNKQFAKFVTEKLLTVGELNKARENEEKPEDAIYKYLTTKSMNSKFFVRKPVYYDLAKEWVLEKWPRLGLADIPSLSKVLQIINK